MEKIPKSLRMMIMKCVKIFLTSALFLSGCQKAQDEEVIDLDRMVMSESEVNQHLAGEPLETPQEMLMDEESDSFE